MKNLLFLSALIFLVHPMAFACPLGAGEEKLTLQRVMRNFDKYTRLADSSVRRGSESASSVTDSEIEQVLSDFTVFNSCIDAVLTSNDMDLYPSKAKRLNGKEQEDFIAKYLDYMERLKVSATSYSSEFESLKSQPIEQRNFSHTVEIKKSFDDLVSEAHYSF